MFCSRSPVFPYDASVLPHGPTAPDAVELTELVRGECAAHRALGAAWAVEGYPIGSAADDGFLCRCRVAQPLAQAEAVFEIRDRIHAGALVHTGDEFLQPIRAGEGVEIADQQDASTREAAGGTDGANPVDEAVRLRSGILIHGDVMVCAEHHALAVGGFEEIAELFVEQRPLGGAGDQGEPAVCAEGGDAALGVALAAALDLLRIPTGNIQHRRRSRNAGAAEAGAALGKKRDDHQGKEAQSFHHGASMTTWHYRPQAAIGVDGGLPRTHTPSRAILR